MTVYDPTDEEDEDVSFEKVKTKARLRKELGLTTGLKNVGSSPAARMGHNVDENLRRESARNSAADRVAEARKEADPDGLLSDQDVKEVLEREGVKWEP